MRDTNFKVGDRVRVLTVKQMKREFGSGGCRCGFVSEMKKFCGLERTIKELLDEGKDKNGRPNWKVYFELEPDDDEDVLDWNDWAWSTDMIEKVEGKEMPKYKVGDKVILRTYDDLAKEYGKSKDGGIRTPNLHILKGLMVKYIVENGGQTVTVKSYEKDGDYWSCEFEEFGFYWNACVILRKADEDKPMPKGGKPVGKIKSFEEAKAAILGRLNCSGTQCTECCITKHFRKNGETVDCTKLANDGAQFLINYIEGKGAETPQPEKKPTRKPLGSGKCKDCRYKEPLPGGYYLCMKWHNFTVEDGYCHYYDKFVQQKKEVEAE